MKYLKVYGKLFFALLEVYILGLYSVSEVSGYKDIEPYQWAITSILAVMFLVGFLEEYKKL